MSNEYITKIYFANFLKLKIDTDYNYKTINLPIIIEKPFIGMKTLQDKTVAALTDANIESSEMPTLFRYEIKGDLGINDIDDLVNFILSLANVIVPTTLKFLETGKGYKRERRLDVPEKLKPLHVSYSCLKRACNNEIKVPIMNIAIAINNVCYFLCDSREIDEIKEEKESKDE